MKKQILEIINNEYTKADWHEDNKRLAGKIDILTHEHYIKFTKWLRENVEGASVHWWIKDVPYTDEEIYQYWLDKIADK